MRYFATVFLLMIILLVELKTASISWKTSRKKHYGWEEVINEQSPTNFYRHQMLMNNGGMIKDQISDRVESIIEPASTTVKENKSLILNNFLNGIRNQQIDLLDENASESSERDSKEIMEMAEVYFRPLSRYRDLQQRRKNQTESKNQNESASEKRYTLLSKSPEYCLPAKGGIICFYKV